MTNSFVATIQNNRLFVKNPLRDERTDSFPKISFVGDNSVVWFPKKRFLVLRSKLKQKFL